MNTMFQNLNVVEILRVGISGLLFLFSLLAYNLINREQQRDGYPRQGIVKSIYAFMTINFLGAVLVFASGFFGPCNDPKIAAEQAELRKAEGELSRIKDASRPLLEVRQDVISQLPDNLPQKQTLRKLLDELKELHK
jgi:hypothetical protein